MNKPFFVLVLFLLVSISSIAQTYDLKVAQTILKSEGFNPGIIDGLRGRKTDLAMRQYQIKNDLEVTGLLNQETWSHLININKPKVLPMKQQRKPIVMADANVDRRLLRLEKMMQSLQRMQQNPTIPTQVTKPNLVAGQSTQAPIATPRIIMNAKRYIPKTTDKTLILGIVAKRGKRKAIKKWGKLADYLSANLKGYHVKLQPESITDTYKKIEEMDYLLGNPKIFVEFEYEYGFRAVVTLRNLRLGKAYDSFGVVLFTRKDSGINSIKDFSDKKMGMVAAKAWGGWVLGWHTLMNEGFDPYKEMASVEGLGTHDKVVYAVLEGKIDIGNVRTDTIERMANAGLIKSDDLKLLHENTKYGAKFPFWLSSKLYPEWSFAAGPRTDENINRKIAALLLTLERTSAASKAGKNAGWTISANYQPVHGVLRDLRLKPYQDYGKITMTDVLNKYWAVILLGFLFLAGLLVASLYFRKIGNKLSNTNKNLIDAQAQLVQSEKMAGIGTMVAGITHEINTPLAFAKSNIDMIQEEITENYELFIEMNNNLPSINKDTEEMKTLVEDVSERLDDKTIFEMIGYVSKGLNSVSELVISLKNYSRLDRSTNDVVDIHVGLDGTLLIANNTIKTAAEVHKKYGENIPEVECSPSQINQAVMNLLMNGVHAIEEKKAAFSIAEQDTFHGLIIVETWSDEKFVYLRIADNGIGIERKILKQIYDPMFTTKAVGKGMGMGLALTKQIIEKHKGTLTVESNPGEGAAFTIKLPIHENFDLGGEL